MTRNFVELILTCKDRAEADKIVNFLLEQKLVACVKFMPVDSRFWWQGKIVDASEVMVLMESVSDNLDAIEVEIEKLHSYDTPVLIQIPAGGVSKKVSVWVEEVINSKD